MPTKSTKMKVTPDFLWGQFMGFGMGVFFVSIPLKDLASTGWPRLALGTAGLILWICGLASTFSKNRGQAEGAKTEANEFLAGPAQARP